MGTLIEENTKGPVMGSKVVDLRGPHDGLGLEQKSRSAPQGTRFRAQNGHVRRYSCNYDQKANTGEAVPLAFGCGDSLSP